MKERSFDEFTPKFIEISVSSTPYPLKPVIPYIISRNVLHNQFEHSLCIHPFLNNQNETLHISRIDADHGRVTLNLIKTGHGVSSQNDINISSNNVCTREYTPSGRGAGGEGEKGRGINIERNFQEGKLMRHS